MLAKSGWSLWTPSVYYGAIVGRINCVGGRTTDQFIGSKNRASTSQISAQQHRVSEKWNRNNTNVPKATSSRESSVAPPKIRTSYPTFRVQKISRAMKAYLENSKKHEEFIQNEKAEFELGKRHLANIMGLDPDTMTQEDIDKAIEYLFPSGLFSPRSRPMMKPPEMIQPKHKSAQFGVDGRPFHPLFYTVKPNFYQQLYEISMKQEKLELFEDRQFALGITEPEEKLMLAGTDWLSRTELSEFLNENIREEEYNQFVAAIDHLAAQPFAIREKDFIMSFRREIAQGLAQKNTACPYLSNYWADLRDLGANRLVDIDLAGVAEVLRIVGRSANSNGRIWTEIYKNDGHAAKLRC